jgi:hypothetical protein
MLPSLCRAVRSVNVQARVTDDPAVLWTVLTAQRGTGGVQQDPGRSLQGCTWTYLNDLGDGTAAELLDFRVDARAYLCTLLA